MAFVSDFIKNSILESWNIHSIVFAVFCPVFSYTALSYLNFKVAHKHFKVTARLGLK